MKTKAPTPTPTDRESTSWKAATARRDLANTALGAARAASEAARRPGYPPPPETRVELLVLEAESLTSVDVEASARARLTWTLDAQDLATGDPSAVACGLEPLAKDLDACIAEIVRLREAIAEEDRLIFSRVEGARAAHAALAVKRTTAGLPEPRRIPNPDGGFFELVANLKATIAKGPIAASSNVEKISRIRREEISERAAHEREIREREAARQREKDHQERDERERDERAKKDADELAASRAEHADARAAEMDLANAQRQRQRTA